MIPGAFIDICAHLGTSADTHTPSCTDKHDSETQADICILRDGRICTHNYTNAQRDAHL